MVDVPTPGPGAEEAEEGNEPRSLGDAAREKRDPIAAESIDIPPFRNPERTDSGAEGTGPSGT